MKYSFSCFDFSLEMFLTATRVTCVYTPVGSYPYVHVYDIEDDFSFPCNKKEVDDFILKNFSFKV